MASDRSEILRGLKVYHCPGDTFEIRIPGAGKAGTISGYFTDFTVAADAVLGRADEFAVYATINPTNPKLIARANNRLKTYAKSTTNDSDIVKLNWLPMDGDPPRPAGIPSTDEEHDLSLRKCSEIRDWLVNKGWPANAFVRVDSGNGGYLLARIELENTSENHSLVERCLKALDYLYSDEGFTVDTTSANPARILRVPGTTNAKGDEVGDMRHRMARILEAPESFEVVPQELLEELAAMLPEQEAPPKEAYSGTGFDPVAYCKTHNIAVHHSKSWTDPKGVKCTLAVLEQCVFNPDHYLSAVIIGWPNGMRSYRCRHNSCLDKHWADARAIIEPGAGDHHPPPADEPRADEVPPKDPTPEPDGSISEEEASKYAIPSNPKLVLNLERDNFINQFIAYGGELSDAFPDYWLMGALELLAIINDQKTYVPLRTERVFPNVYLNLLGASTTSHKSTILKKVASILDRLNTGQYHEAPENGSPEGWLEAMSETPRAYCNQDESSGFLNRMKKQDYMSGMTEMLNNCYDGTSFTKRNTKKRKGEPSSWRIERPYYNQMYATTPSKFSFATSAIDIHSGFWVRFLHAYPNYARDNFTPLGEASEELAVLDDAIIERLQKICEQMLDPTITRANLTPEGWEFFRKWQIKWNRAIRNKNDDFLGQIVGRYTIYVVKLAQLFTMGRSDFTREKMVISTEHIQEACVLVDSYCVPHALAVRDLIGEGSAKDANLIIKIETVLRVHGGRLSHRALLRKTQVVQKLLDDALLTMKVSGAVTIKKVKNPHGPPTETIFLNEADKVILSSQERQYENQDVVVESKKAKTDNTAETGIYKTTTEDYIQDTVSPYCHNVSDETVKPLSDACGSGRVYNTAADSISIKSKRYKATQKPPKTGPDSMLTVSDSMASPTSSNGIADFKSKVAARSRNTCRLCGKHFEVPLKNHYESGFICEPCRRDGAPCEAPVAAKVDVQTSLADVPAA